MAKVNKMEKTLREELAIIIQQEWNNKPGASFGVFLDDSAASVIEHISQRIKAKALTDEQIKKIEGEIFYQSTHLHDGDGFEFKVQKAVAAAQLQAVLGELE